MWRRKTHKEWKSFSKELNEILQESNIQDTGLWKLPSHFSSLDKYVITDGWSMNIEWPFDVELN